jgi:hypothetical protein
MKTWFLILALVGVSACASAPIVRSPQAVAALAATQTIQALDLIRDFVIAANAQTPPLVSTSTTYNVVFYHQEAIKAIKAVEGITSWKGAVQDGFDYLVKTFSPAEKALLQPYIDIVTAVLNGVV